jgi:hypothetical protein
MRVWVAGYREVGRVKVGDLHMLWVMGADQSRPGLPGGGECEYFCQHGRARPRKPGVAPHRCGHRKAKESRHAPIR